MRSFFQFEGIKIDISLNNMYRKALLLIAIESVHSELYIQYI